MTNRPTQALNQSFLDLQVPKGFHENVVGLVFSDFCFMHHGLALLDAFWSDQKRQESMFVEGFLEAMPMQIVKFCEMFF